MKDNVVQVGDFSLRSRYLAKARYHALGDFVEYLRGDKPYIMRRIDNFLTIALDLETRQAAGFRLKGFKHFYHRHFKLRGRVLDDQFHAIVTAIEVAVTSVGDETFADLVEIKSAYKSAHAIAAEDNVSIQPAALAA